MHTHVKITGTKSGIVALKIAQYFITLLLHFPYSFFVFCKGHNTFYIDN